MASTEIEWATKVWNVTRGCRRVSPGCGGPHNQGGCYAERQAIRQSGPGGAYEGLVENTGKGPRWTGKGRFAVEKLDEPLRLRQPRDGSRHRIFVNSMSDLFFEEFTNEQIAAVFGVMAAAPQHDFLVLTKRADRMREWFGWVEEQGEHGASPWDVCMGAAADAFWPLGLGEFWQTRVEPGTFSEEEDWPLPWVWLGVSAEDQQRADERIPHLLATPAAVRFVSVEPLLGALNLTRYLHKGSLHSCENMPLDWACPAGNNGVPEEEIRCELGQRKLDWVIVGGESGPGARPCDVAWIRSIVEQCRAAGVAVFCKQLGGNVRDRNDAGFDGEDGDAWDLKERLFDRGVIDHDPDGIRNDYQGAPVRIRLRDRKGGDVGEWPADMRVRQFPEVRS
jgi:protein gp37